MRFLVILTVLALSACKSETPPPAEPSEPTGAESARDDEPATGAGESLLTEKVKIKNDAGDVAELKPKDDGAKLVDPAGDELARYKAKGNKLKIKGSNDEVIGYVKGDRDKLKLLAADGETERYALKRYDDKLKLKTASGDTVYELEKKDYGWKAVDAKDELVFKVKKKGDKTVIRDAKDATLFSTKSPVSLDAFACLGFEELTLPERGGLFLMAQKVSND